MSKLTPEQIALKQQQVINHVQQEAVKQGLSAAEAEAMLAQTLEYNGLPQVNNNPITGALGNLFKIGSNTVNKIGLPAPTSSNTQSQDLVPGLPVPGTLEHTVTLALFNAQQYINQILSPSQPAIDNKLGVAAGASEGAGDGGIISAVSSLPTSLTSAAVQVLKFVGEPPQSMSSSSSSGTPGQSYSEVVTGVDPTYAALGVLTTGALASVAYSYVASDSDIASSATDLALGAVDAIARNDIVQNIANNDIVEKIKNNEMVRKATDAISNNKLLRKASSAIASIKKKLTGVESENVDSEEVYNIDSNYDISGYGDYGAGLYQTNFDYYQELAYTDRYPYQEAANREAEDQSEADGWYMDMENGWSDDSIEWFDPESSTVPETVPFVPYSDDTNPWRLMSSGQSTDHLYRAFPN